MWSSRDPTARAGSWDPAFSSVGHSELLNNVYSLFGGAIKANPTGS